MPRTGKSRTTLASTSFFRWGRRLLKVLSWSVLLLFTGLVLFVLALAFAPVQTWVLQRVLGLLGDGMGISLRVGHAHIDPFGELVLRDVLVGDMRGDTLFHVAMLRTDHWGVHTGTRNVHLGRLRLDDGRFRLDRHADDAHTNLTLLLDRLSSGDTTSTGPPWAILCERFDITGFHFSFHDDHEPLKPFGVDFSHIDIRQGEVHGTDLVVIEDSVRAFLDHVSMVERSGLVVHDFHGDAQVSGTGLVVNGMRIRTPGSQVEGDLRFVSGSWDDYEDFLRAVRMRLDLRPSRIDFTDIAWFATDLEGIELELAAQGVFRGTVEELKARDAELSFGEGTRFRGHVEMSGLPDIASTFLLIDVDELTTTRADLQRLPSAPFTERGRLAVPDELGKLGTMDFTGNFTGFLNAFTAYGRAGTALGALRTDMSFRRDTLTRQFRFSGNLGTDGFDLGPLAGDATLGAIACDLRLKANGRDLASLQADLEGQVPRFTVNGTTITDIRLNGRLERNLFNGHLECADPYLELVFDGLADLRGRWPKVDFSAELRRADLFELNILPRYHLGDLSFRLEAEGELAPDSLKGWIDLEAIRYCDDRGEHLIGDLSLHSSMEKGLPVVDVVSSMLDVEVRGPFLPTRVPEALRNVFFSVFPALRERTDYAQAEQRFRFDVVTKDLVPLFNVLDPDLFIQPGCTITGGLDSRTFGLDLTADIPGFRYKEYSGDSIRIILDKTIDVLAFRLHSRRQQIGDSAYINGIHLTGKAYQDELDLRMGWAGSSRNTTGEVVVQGQVMGPERIDFDLLPSRLFLGVGDWVNDRTAHLRYDAGDMVVDSLELRNAHQRIRIDGVVSSDPLKQLTVELERIALANLRPFHRGPSLHGELTGDARLFDLLGEPYLFSFVRLDSLKVESRPVGDIRLGATWGEGSRRMEVSGTVQRGELKALEFSGSVSPTAGDDQLDLRIDLDEFDLAFIDPYLPEGISGIRGTVSGGIDITGALAEPKLDGRAHMRDAGLRIDYLNTAYTFSNEVRILPDAFWMDRVVVRDEEGNQGIANGTINHQGYGRWNFDVSMEMRRMLCLNTRAADNELYFGRAYASGDLGVSGSDLDLEINFDGRSERGTVISLPLGSGKDVGSIDFIRFHAGGLGGDTLFKPVDLTGVRLNMNVEVTEEARFELIFDPTVGDILSGSGRGNLEFTVTPSGDLSMRGDLEVTTGSYLFTLRNVLNKKFEVDPGGHITWYGDPFDAQLALNAVYRVRAPLYDIIPAERTEAFTKRVPIDVVMQLKDRLANPDIAFDLRLPTVDENIRTQVNSLLSDRDELNRQVFSLIVLNRFLPVDRLGVAGGAVGSGGNVVGTTGSELLSNQVSNWLSRLSREVDLGFNYRPGDAITQDELEVAVSTQLFNERLVLSTNLGVQYGNTTGQRTSNLVGDFQAEYILTRDRKLRLKAFNQSNDRNLNQVDQAPTTQGAGLAYREEFNDLGELSQKLLNLFRKADRKRRFD